ncbi:MAG: hypothetical protein AAFQ42_01920 [Pseudomonadota bacterium]
MRPAPGALIHRARRAAGQLLLVAFGVMVLLGVPNDTRAASRGASDTAAPRVPDLHYQALLVHSTLTALDQANRTGNYTVLRALSAPAFQRNNPPDRLAQIFAGFRRENVNLGPAVLHDPLLRRPAYIDANGLLRLDGFYPTRPLRVTFKLSFRLVDGGWRLFGLTVEPRPTGRPTRPAAS